MQVFFLIMFIYTSRLLFVIFCCLWTMFVWTHFFIFNWFFTFRGHNIPHLSTCPWCLSIVLCNVMCISKDHNEEVHSQLLDGNIYLMWKRTAVHPLTADCQMLTSVFMPALRFKLSYTHVFYMIHSVILSQYCCGCGCLSYESGSCCQEEGPAPAAIRLHAGALSHNNNWHNTRCNATSLWGENHTITGERKPHAAFSSHSSMPPQCTSTTFNPTSLLHTICMTSSVCAFEKVYFGFLSHYRYVLQVKNTISFASSNYTK